jgi:hypothetical protein
MIGTESLRAPGSAHAQLEASKLWPACPKENDANKSGRGCTGAHSAEGSHTRVGQGRGWGRQIPTEQWIQCSEHKARSIYPLLIADPCP